jgi:hypothetical protein
MSRALCAEKRLSTERAAAIVQKARESGPVCVVLLRDRWTGYQAWHSGLVGECESAELLGWRSCLRIVLLGWRSAEMEGLQKPAMRRKMVVDVRRLMLHSGRSPQMIGDADMIPTRGQMMMTLAPTPPSSSSTRRMLREGEVQGLRDARRERYAGSGISSCVSACRSSFQRATSLT